MSDIPTNVFLEILKRVPVDSLFRFRSVCKTWRQLIDYSDLSEVHIDGGMGEHSLLIRSNNGKVLLLPLTSLTNVSLDTCAGDGCTETECCVKLVDAKNIESPVGPPVPNFPVPSCNGMLLISNSRSNCAWLIWNPFTGESLKVPKLNCDSTYFGFGYDEENDDYKVVRVVEPDTFVYSVNSGDWNKIEESSDWDDIEKLDGVYADGALHWLVSSNDNGDLGWIRVFHLASETYDELELPTDVGIDEQEGCSLELVALDGCLFLSFVNPRNDLIVWKISNDYDDKEILSLYEDNIPLMAYLESQEKALFSYGNDKFMWYDAMKKFQQEVSVEVNPDAYEEDECEYLYDTFTYQVLRSSLARLKIGDDGSTDQCDASKRTSNKKRKRTDANQRLSLKISYGSLIYTDEDTDEE